MSQPLKPASRSFAAFPCSLAAIWLVWYSSLSIFLHETYRSTAEDLALHSQLLWNLAHGRFMATSLAGNSLLQGHFAGNHFWPGLYLLVPCYQLWGVHSLLVLQSLAVAMGAIPAYALARDITGSKAWARSLAMAYLLQPTLSVGVLFDFHPELLCVPLLLAAILAFRRHQPAAWVWAALACSFYEVAAIVLFVFGVSLLCVRNRRSTGVLLAALSLAYLCIVLLLVMPNYSAGTAIPHPGRYSHLGATLPGVLQMLLFHPFRSLALSMTHDKAWNICMLLLSFGLLPLFSPKHLVPGLPLVFFLLISNYGRQMDIRYGYIAPALPFIFLAAAHGACRVGWICKTRPRFFNCAAPWLAAIFALAVSIYFQVELSLRPHPFTICKNLKEIREAAKLIPPGASLMADHQLGAHFADRTLLLSSPPARGDLPRPEYIFTDLNEFLFKDQAWYTDMEKMVGDGGYSPVYFSGDVALLRTGVENQPLLHSFLSRLRQQAGVFLARSNPSKSQPTYAEYSVSGSDLQSKTGKIVGSSLLAEQSVDKPGYLAFGPYIRLQPGFYRITIAYRYLRPPAPDTSLFYDLVCWRQSKAIILDQCPIAWTGSQPQEMVRELQIESQPEDTFEARTFYRGSGSMQFKSLTFKRVHP